jgi:DNA-binding winged helix-turn-helix (wHTH) protein
VTQSDSGGGSGAPACEVWRAVRFAFGSYTFDTASLKLDCYGVALPVKPKTAHVLEYFLRHSERLVTKNELMDGLWPDEDVTEANLAQHVFLLRRLFALHSPNETFILTAARHGYRFVAPVRAIGGDARLQTPAWKAYVRGRFFADQRTGESLKAARDAFEAACAADPSFAAAHSGIASVQVLRAEYLFEPPAALAGARGAAELALSLDASDVEAHLALGDVALFYDWDPARALESYDRALFIDPAGARTRVLRAWYFSIVGEDDRAVHEIETALRHQPLSLELLTTLGAIDLNRGAFASALEHCEYVLEMNPQYALARYYRRCALAYGDDPEEGLRAFDAEEPNVSYAQQSLSIAGYAAARAGDAERAEASLRALEDGRFLYVSPVNIARVLAGLGRAEEAAAQLRRAVEERDTWAVFIPGNRAFRTLPGHESLARSVLPRPVRGA